MQGHVRCEGMNYDDDHDNHDAHDDHDDLSDDYDYDEEHEPEQEQPAVQGQARCEGRDHDDDYDEMTRMTMMTMMTIVMTMMTMMAIAMTMMRSTNLGRSSLLCKGGGGVKGRTPTAADQRPQQRGCLHFLQNWISTLLLKISSLCSKYLCWQNSTPPLRD